MTALQSLSDNSNSYTIPVVVSTDSLFLLQLRFSSLMLWVVIFNYSLAIWGVMFWDSSFCLNLLFNRPSMMLHEWEREASPCYYCQVRSGVQIPHGASTDTGKVGGLHYLWKAVKFWLSSRFPFDTSAGRRGEVRHASLPISHGGSVGAPHGESFLVTVCGLKSCLHTWPSLISPWWVVGRGTSHSSQPRVKSRCPRLWRGVR